MILVTGATGHIGNVLVRDLLARGEQVRALVLPGEDLTPLDGLKLEVVVGDVLDRDALQKAFEGVSLAYHLAGIISIMPGVNEMVQRVNVQGTRNVLEAARLASVKRLVYTSSIHALARVPHGTTIDESIPFDPDNPVGEYDRSKAQATLAVLEAVQDGLDAVIVCPTGVIGPNDYRGSEMGKLIEECAESKPQLYVEGAYDFVDVRDVSRGLTLAGEKGQAGEVYILSGERITVQGMLDLVEHVTGKHLKRFKIPMWLARFITHFTPTYYRLTRQTPRFTPYSLETISSNSEISHAKAHQELGYQPRTLRQSVADTVDWLRWYRQPFANESLNVSPGLPNAEQ
jgi:dihydroflavonol-4-reductase